MTKCKSSAGKNPVRASTKGPNSLLAFKAWPGPAHLSSPTHAAPGASSAPATRAFLPLPHSHVTKGCPDTLCPRALLCPPSPVYTGMQNPVQISAPQGCFPGAPISTHHTSQGCCTCACGGLAGSTSHAPVPELSPAQMNKQTMISEAVS